MHQLYQCKSLHCSNPAHQTSDFCVECLDKQESQHSLKTMAEKYPAYYKSVGDMSEVDVYAIHHLFNLQDPSGAIHHASKKLLLSGVRTGGKSVKDDIREARDTLNRWLELQEHI